MAVASKAAGRAPADTSLIAVTKTFAAADIAPLIAAGHRHFGENRVQEAAAKWPALRAATPGLTLHLIGQLQSNKADQAVALFDVIHSVDRPSLITALARAMARAGRQLPVLLQVNIGAEEQKGGCAIADTPALLAAAREAGLDVTGLMAVPPADREPAPYFALLAKMARELGLPQLSMGMSGDFETAIQQGSTMVRVGSALFGARQ
ncbi:MAG: YggS family pyridoxal phosphate-dependent enzyme [Polymorphobacter sp.]|uniref:YggS family pyridoxal phosphate-dependent enzyme n=1 Tax=Polymorphobacter sp. TaxID=1909290 RepID=UPI003A8B10DC